MNSWNARGGARPGLVSATDGRVGLSVELDEALARVRTLGRSVATAESHEQRAAELREIIGEARRALVVSTSLSSSSDGESGVVPRRSHPTSRVAPTEWLLRSVVHDLNNMLLVIQNCAESLRHTESVSVQREAHVVQDAVNQATHLVAKLVPSDPGIGRPAGVELSDCVERFAGVLGSLVGDAIEVVTRLATDLPPVRCEETAIFRVLSNLAANARDAMPAGGTLTVETSGVTSLPGERSAESAGGKLFALLTLVDTGEGMDVATSDRAFEPFFTTKAPGKGTGVGLTAVREIVESMGGLVQMESAPGFGTKVSVYLECTELPA
jgi:signal transduction histidine kinase